MGFSLGAILAIPLIIAVPLTGALVRLRANYNPKEHQLDPEGNVEAHPGPVVTSFFGMLRRVKRIEGWSGLYKGMMPTLLASAVLAAYGLFSMLVSLPATIKTYRSITTPHKLPYFRPVYSLLLTPTERRKPWILYLTPGLLLSQILHVVCTAFILRALRSFLFSSIKFGIHVLATKLAIQRNHAAPEYNSNKQEVEEDAVVAEEYTEYSGVEDVIRSATAYLDLVDCAKRWLIVSGPTWVLSWVRLSVLRRHSSK
ncbi:hypothetical protein BKA93DRAFT_818693 [Sparassis latifolia]